MKEIMVSVIVPVYNVEQYIERCIRSILNQTYKNYELILVDDGSTDKSYELCKKYCKVSNRVKAFTQKNGGPNAARLLGVDNAKGEYVLFVDSDDWIEPDMLEFLVVRQQESGTDIVTSGVFMGDEFQWHERTDSIEEGLYENSDKINIYNRLLIDKHIDDAGVLYFLCAKLIRRNLVRDALYKVPKSIKYGEDLAALFTCIIHAESIYVTKKTFYHYYMRDNSAVNSIDYRFLENINKCYNFMKCMIPENQHVLKLQLDAWLIRNVYIGVNQGMGIDKQFLLPSKILVGIDKLQAGKKVVLYGAGKIGQPVYTWLKSLNKYDIVTWVDKNYSKYQKTELDVHSVDTINKVRYDYIIIAVKGKDFADAIKDSLIKRYGIPSHKILYFEPKNILDSYFDLDRIFERQGD